MEFLPESTILGSLSVIEIYEYYDIPSLFSCKNSTGHIFLVLSVDENDDSLTWFYLPVSPEKLNDVRYGKTDLYDAFKYSEDGLVFEVKTYYKNNVAAVSHLYSAHIEEDLLPEKGYRLQISKNLLKPISKDDYMDVHYMASQHHRETLNCIFDFSNSINCTAPSKELSKFLTSIQELFSSIGKRFFNEFLRIDGHRLDTTIAELTKINVSFVFQGSFGIQLIANNEADQENNSLIGIAISKFFSLLENSTNQTSLHDILNILHGNVAVKYLNFLKAVEKSKIGLQCQWGSPKNGFGGNKSISKMEIINAITIVDETIEEMSEENKIRCKLIGLNVRTNNFEIKRLDDEPTKITGKIANDANISVYNATINQEYIAVLRQVIKTKTHSGYEDIKWLLLSLE